MNNPSDRVSSNIRVYAVASFEPVRVGLRDGFASAGDIDVVGDCASFFDLIEDSRSETSDVLLVDAAVLNPANMTAYAHLQEKVPDLKVLFLGSQPEAETISVETLRWVLKVNTIGFIFKDGTIDRVIEAVRLVASGAFVCEAEIMRRILLEVAQSNSPRPAQASGQLSDREAEVLGLVGYGLSNKEIARRLSLSEGTVKAHVSHIMAKLRLDRRAELVRYAISNGLALAA